MFSNTFKNLKETFKKGVDFIKAGTIGTITSLKNDICQYSNDIKEFKEFRKNKHSTENSEKSE